MTKIWMDIILGGQNNEHFWDTQITESHMEVAPPAKNQDNQVHGLGVIDDFRLDRGKEVGNFQNLSKFVFGQTNLSGQLHLYS